VGALAIKKAKVNPRYTLAPTGYAGDREGQRESGQLRLAKEAGTVIIRRSVACRAIDQPRLAACGAGKRKPVDREQPTKQNPARSLERGFGVLPTERLTTPCVPAISL